MRAWWTGRYRFPLRSALLVFAALAYLVMPLDLIPDALPFVGVIDDAAVFALVLRAIRKDLLPFSQWESRHA